jgi:hypothetical protein
MNVIELWWLSLAIFAVVVVVVAVLLGMIVAAAKSIDHHACAIWTEGKKIAGNTVSIWMLEKTNEYAHKVWQSANAVEMHAGSMDEKLTALSGRR